MFQLLNELQTRIPSISQENPTLADSVSDDEEDGSHIMDEISVEPFDDEDPEQDETVEEEEEEPLGVHGPELRVVWLFEKEFQNRAEFDEFLTAEGCWSSLKGEQQYNGMKTKYRCNKVKRRGLPCSSGIYTLHDFAPNNPKIKLFRKNLGHNCEHSLNKVTKVSDEVREIIITEHKKGNSPNGILYLLQQNPDIVLPTKNQVNNTISQYKKAQYGSSTITLTELENFAKHHEKIPENNDDGFVVNFERSDPRGEEKWFRIFYSTKRLLRTASSSKTMHADGTYKLIIQGFPVLVIGVSDYAKNFHVTGLAICSNETSADYKFIFESLRKGISMVSTEPYHPEVLVGDAAQAITIGFEEIFGDGEFSRVNCFAHLMMNVDKRKFRSIENKDKIKDDIRYIYVIPNGFSTLVAHFLMKNGRKWNQNSY